MPSHEVSLKSGADIMICGIKLGTALQSIIALHWQDRNYTVQSGFLPQKGLVAVSLFFGLIFVRKNLSSNCTTM